MLFRSQAKRSEQEIERELLSTLLEEKELGEKVKIGGVDVWSHVAWADKITCVSGPLLCMAGYSSLWATAIGCAKQTKTKYNFNSVHRIPEMLIYHYNLISLSL